jgi:hypothetical protein
VSETTTALFVVRIDPPGLSKAQSLMSDAVCGVLSPLSDLEALTDWAAIKKVRFAIPLQFTDSTIQFLAE